ncbi:PTS sugar transporter subunit IIA [Pseudocitrobacter vendiensis]|uniref:Phosphotransferase system mannitol/fructose-specifc IIA component (Ntr-type) n=1 Tax=Pseudocitrobacter vendiensis TaxID=2488306 RepID=A0ABM9FAG8_9ENTR|nr:PTS sugar transporter subunit IIA [Pseudocitrobacter vendiensis]CAH6660162.1 Phosphotransferase system mannitol/fructose-specifc IIA component (Ntr-type) [Pseudocitrobacter vendiensis]
MLNQWLNDTTIALKDEVESWPQALEICAQPLLKSGIIEPGYVTAIIQQHQKLSPYYVLAPGLAMPHARPEEGAHAIGLSLLKLQRGVAFGADEFDPVDVIIMLAAPDKHSHIEMISALAELFSSEDDLALLHQAKTLEEITTIISRF